MKRLLVVVVLIMGVSLTACSGTKESTLTEPDTENPVVEQKTDEPEERKVEGVTFKIGDKELEFPYDFTQNNLLVNGFTRNVGAHDGYRITSPDEDDSIDIKYSNGMTTSYVSDSIINHGVDMMYLKGFTYEGSDIEIVGGMTVAEPENSDSDVTYSNAMYTVSMHRHDGQVTGMSLICNNAEYYYQAEPVDWNEFDIQEYEYDGICDTEGCVVYKTERGDEHFPSTYYRRNRSITNIPFTIGYSSDEPSLILHKTDDGEEVVGILFENKGDKVADFSIGGNFYEELENIGIDFKDLDNDCVRFTSEDSLADIFVQNDGNEVSRIALVEKDYLDTLETDSNAGGIFE